jgi:Domain of unknown function (DUF4383)
MARQRHAPARFPAPQVTLLVLGALFLVWGIVGFFFLGDPASDLAGRDTNHGLLGLETNALQNVIHVVLGLVALASTSNETAMRVGGVVLAVAGAALTVAGVIGLAIPDANVFSQNLPATIVHGVTALVGLAIALVPMPRPAGQAAGPANPPRDH